MATPLSLSRVPEPDDQSADDGALVDLLRTGDERALATLYDRHAPTLLGVVMRVVPQRADAEAVLMATFLQAWRSAGTFDGARGTVLGWLTMIARSRALDQARASRRRARLEPLGDGEDAAVSAERDVVEPDPLAGIETDERRRSIAAALATLQPAQRVAIELAFFEGLTHVEVAKRLAEPLGTVKTRIRLGMMKLRESLASLAKERNA